MTGIMIGGVGERLTQALLPQKIEIFKGFCGAQHVYGFRRHPLFASCLPCSAFDRGAKMKNIQASRK